MERERLTGIGRGFDMRRYIWDACLADDGAAADDAAADDDDDDGEDCGGGGLGTTKMYGNTRAASRQTLPTGPNTTRARTRTHTPTGTSAHWHIGNSGA